MAYHPLLTMSASILAETLSSFSHISVGEEVLSMLATPCCPTSAPSSLLSSNHAFLFHFYFPQILYLHQISLASWLRNESFLHFLLHKSESLSFLTYFFFFPPSISVVEALVFLARTEASFDDLEFPAPAFSKIATPFLPAS